MCLIVKWISHIFLFFLIFLFIFSSFNPRNQIEQQDINGIKSFKINTNFNPDNWNISSPIEQDFNLTRLNEAYMEIENLISLRSILVVRNGFLVVEYYFQGYKETSWHVHSVSKSITSALIGIAIKQNFLQGLDQKMLDFFPEYITPELDPRKFNITLKHLITMRAGFNFTENAEDWIAYSTSPNWVEYALNLPLMHDPGERFHYSTPQTNLLSAILTKATAMSTKDFADKFLFEPLNISIQHWHQDPQEYYTGGHEMYFRSRDMARFGYLYLRNGLMEEGNQIVPSEWIEQSLINSLNSTTNNESIRFDGYGFGWWLGNIHGYPMYSAIGLGGQLILNIPELNLTIVTTAEASILNEEPMSQFGEIVDFVGSIVNSVNLKQNSTSELVSSKTITNSAFSEDNSTNEANIDPKTSSINLYIFFTSLIGIIIRKKRKRKEISR
jgi:CubicO group peptidase (beta-lactamase class C family)